MLSSPSPLKVRNYEQMDVPKATPRRRSPKRHAHAADGEPEVEAATFLVLTEQELSTGWIKRIRK
jgi:hypothetical protein